MTKRPIQNFQGFRAIVSGSLLPEPLRITLTQLGLPSIHLPEHDAAALEAELVAERDVVFLDGDRAAPSGMLPYLGGRRLPVPVIGLVGTEAPSRLRMLVEAGATAFLRKPVHAGAVYSSLFLAINAYRRRQEAEQNIAEHERRRRGRRHVIKAILQVMQQEALDDDAAYELLRHGAMRARVGIEDFCETWLQKTSAATPVSDETPSEDRCYA